MNTRYLKTIALICTALILLITNVLASSQTDEPMPSSTNITPDDMIPTEDCPLPCWWGIVPGETTYLDGVNLIEERFHINNRYPPENEPVIDGFATLSIINGMPHEDPNKRHHLLESVSMIWIIESGVIQYLSLSSGAGEPPTLWSYFDIQNMLEIYGVPDDIVPIFRIENGEYLFLILAFAWQDYAFSIDYWTNIIRLSELPNPNCFNIQDLTSGVGIELWALGKTRSMDDILRNQSAYNPPSSLSEVSALSNDEFIDILLTNDGCLPVKFPEFRGDN